MALVESEKMAVICAGIMLRFLWLATDGKSMINERLLELEGWKIVAYPDIGRYDTWIEKLAQFPDLHVTVSPILQRNATAEDVEAHIDIADSLIRTLRVMPGTDRTSHSKEFLLAAQYLDLEKAPEVEALIDELGLLFVRAEKVDKITQRSSSTSTPCKIVLSGPFRTITYWFSNGLLELIFFFRNV